MIQQPGLTLEKVWLDKFKYDQAEKRFYEKMSKSQPSQQLKKSNNKQQQPPPASKKTSQPAGSSKASSGNKPNQTVKEPICVQPTAPVPSTPIQPPKKPIEVKETADAYQFPESSDLVDKMSSNKCKKVRTYKNEKEKKLVDGTLPSPMTPVTNQPPSFQSQDIITPGPTPTPSDPSLITNKEHKKKKAKKERLRNRSKESKVTNVNNSLASEVAKARHHIKTSLQCIDDIGDIATTAAVDEISVKVGVLQKENSDLKQKVASLSELLAKMETRLSKLESGGKVSTQSTSSQATGAGKPSAPSKPQNDDDDDDGVDLFGSDSEEDDAEAAKIKEQRLAEYAAKKSKKPALIAKSNIILDVKPWSDETDMKKMEQEVRKIEMDGLIWGASKLVPLAFGIHKLQISCVVEDDKVSVDLLQETIEEIEEFVQSVDIAAFNKV